LGYQLDFAQKLGYHMEFGLYALFGTLGQYVRSQNYNWNFQSQIGGGGIHLMYKLLPDKDISPFFTLGVESFEFLSSTDMYDKYGNKYYYWNDGSVRSLPQNASNASSAMILTPDYTYETDIRSLNLGDAGNYSEQTFAIPIGAGFMIHITKKADFSISSTLHYTFTDHIDGLTPAVQGPLHGTRTHDMFLLTAIGLRYDLTKTEHVRGPNDIDESRYDNVNIDASMITDTSHPYASADTTPISDSLARRQYQMYEDSTGQFATVVYDSSTILGGYDKPAYKPRYTTLSVNGKPVASSPNSASTEYMVQLGRYSKGVPAGEMDKLLSVPDVKSSTLKDSSTIYTTGSYGDFNSAKQRQEALEKQGITNTKIVYRKGDEYIPTDKAISSSEKNGANPTHGENGETATGTEKTSTEGGTILYRVQLGAYKHKLSNTHVFANAKNIVEMKTENEYYTYSTGSFTNYQEAEAYRAKLVSQGFSDAFVKAYKNGKRIPVSKNGTEISQPEQVIPKKPKDTGSATNNQVQFKVQLGVFKETPPKDKMKKFKQFSTLSSEKDESGETHYYAGVYSDYASAKAMKEKAIAAGMKDAFITAYINGKKVSLPEALSKLKQ